MERELWTALYVILTHLDEQPRHWKFRNSTILLVYLWAAVHDRPMTWALKKTNWHNDLLKMICLPSQSTLSRRMRQHAVQQLLIDVEQAWLGLVSETQKWIHVIDGKPLAVSGVTKDPDATYGRGAGCMQKGYKLFAIWSGGPLPSAWALAGMNVSEKKMARELIASLPGSGYILGDAEYDSNPLFEIAHDAGYQLLAPKRQKEHGVGHRRQSPYRLCSIELMKTLFGKGLAKFRKQIERDFSDLTGFGGGLICLPPWVRRITRVCNWVHCKLLINAARWLNNHHLLQADA